MRPQCGSLAEERRATLTCQGRGREDGRTGGKIRSEGSVTIVCCGTQMIDKDTPSFLYVSSLQQQPAVSECTRSAHSRQQHVVA